jgi:hypothetical protein
VLALDVHATHAVLVLNVHATNASHETLVLNIHATHIHHAAANILCIFRINNNNI